MNKIKGIDQSWHDVNLTRGHYPRRYPILPFRILSVYDTTWNAIHDVYMVLNYHFAMIDSLFLFQVRPTRWSS